MLFHSEGAFLMEPECPQPGTRLCIATAAVFLLISVLARPAEAQSALVRVNQAGYITSASADKHAYLMSSASEAGATFQVKNSSGASIYSAQIGANPGSWSKSYPFVYALDFSSVTTAGTYTI